MVSELSFAHPWAGVEFGPACPSRMVAGYVFHLTHSLAERVQFGSLLLSRRSENALVLPRFSLTSHPVFLHQLERLQFTPEFHNSDLHSILCVVVFSYFLPLLRNNISSDWFCFVFGSDSCSFKISWEGKVKICQFCLHMYVIKSFKVKYVQSFFSQIFN